MNRIDRLTAILLLLQGGKRTAAEMARHFEVSRRTIQRDIDALCEMGIPIAADLGVAGGYTLPEDYSLPPLALTLHEALLLRLALSGLAQLSSTPFQHARVSLLAKLQTLLPREEHEHLERLQQTLALDVPSRPYPTPFLDQLLESAHRREWLAVTYHSEKGTSRQNLLPSRVYSEAGLWYCEAYSYERGGTRVYRVDRFLEVQPAPESPALEVSVAPIAHMHPSYPEIRIHLTSRGVLKLEHEPHLIVHVQRQEDGQGLLSVCLRPAEYEWLVGIVLTLGVDATVLTPESLRARMQEEARKVLQHYTEL